MSAPVVWLQLSAGAGLGGPPAECGWAVARVAQAIQAEAAKLGLEATVLEAVRGPEPGTLDSCLVELAGEPPPGWLASWAGTVQWVGTSPFRPHHKRKNWFVAVGVLAPPARMAFDLADVRFESMRAGGPGGQHQNKVESAVRATHGPTGVVAIAREARSQGRNRELALARLAAKLADQAAGVAAHAEAARRARHHELERGNPVRTYEGPGFKRR